jgi:hypothetical protein
MNRNLESDKYVFHGKYHKKIQIGLFMISAIFLMLMYSAVHADTATALRDEKISLERLHDHPNGGYGYKLQYYVAAPIDAFWLFKTDFSSALVAESGELIRHKHLKTDGNRVLTENQYSSAPGLIFLWQTTVLPERYRMEFILQNAKDCYHDFHYGSIQLSPAGQFTKVTQIAFFNFRGASFWVHYPWSGGMKSTLTNVVRWEQKVASYRFQQYLVAMSE